MISLPDGSQSKPQLRLAEVTDLPTPGSHRRLWRRLRARRLRDPFARSTLALASAMAFGCLAVLLLLSDQMFWAAPLIAVAGAQLAVYLSIVIEALRRDKTAQYWRDKRDLERRLNRERLHRTVLSATLDRVFDLENDAPDGWSVQPVTLLASLTAELFKALTDGYPDVAVVISHEEGRYCEILRSAHSRGSRWRELQAGKHCRIESSIEHKLDHLAKYHHSVVAESASGWLRLSVLTDSELHERDRELADQTASYLKLIALRWKTLGTARLADGRTFRRASSSG